MATAVSIGIAWAISAILVHPVAGMLSSGLSAVNYRGEKIPASMGIVLLLAVLGSLGLPVLSGRIPVQTYNENALWLTLVCLAGFIDDAAGNHAERGFRGHFSALFVGKLTSGMLKVIITMGAALSLTAPLRKEALLPLGVLILAVNLFNQFDLRPGRALKAFLFLALFFALGGNPVAAAGGGSALGLLPGDLRARFMLGDSGSNLLGALAGLILITSLTGVWLILALILLILGNCLGEFFSISRIIEGSRTLNWLDKLGR